MLRRAIFYIPCIVFCLSYIVGFAQQKKPNIILILTDDQGYHDLGPYGSKEVKTPYLDKLAKEGVRLSNFFTTPVCTPSQGMIITGRYPRRNGTYELFRNDRVNDGHQYTEYEYSISPERILGTDIREVFISQVLKNGGYYNGYIGKWDLGELKRFLPLQRGFDEYFGFPNTGINYFAHERYGIPSMYDGNNPTTACKGIYTTELFQRKALGFLDHASKLKRPFFLYVAFNAPHLASDLDPGTPPVQATEDYIKMYPEGKTKEEKIRRNYKAAITQMDHAVGEILKKVDAMGETNNTLVIFLTDNGGFPNLGADNFPLRGGKGQMFEGGIRVPCIIKWPGHIREGTKNDAFLSGLELFPTIVSAAELSLPNSVVYDGFDMTPVLEGKMKSVRNKMFWWFRTKHAARVNQWKWVSGKNGEGGLFDLSKDIGEKNDLSGLYPKVLDTLKSLFKNWQNQMEDAAPRGPFKDF